MSEKLASISVRVDEIKRVKKRTKNTESDTWQLKGKDNDGFGRINIIQAGEFNGLNPDEVIDVVISKSQRSLDEWKPKPKAKK